MQSMETTLNSRQGVEQNVALIKDAAKRMEQLVADDVEQAARAVVEASNQTECKDGGAQAEQTENLSCQKQRGMEALELKYQQALRKQIRVDRYTSQAIALVDVALEVGVPEKDDTSICGDGSEGRRGFQVMGPEGIRTFDQDERLVMAMTSSASPLIGVLKEVSARVLDRRVVQAEPLLPYAQERVDILEAQRAVDSLKGTPKKAEEVKTDLGKVIEAFARPEDGEMEQ